MLKLLSVNIERDRHTDKILNLISKTSPDVVCLQEVCDFDLERFAEKIGEFFYFSPMIKHVEKDRNYNSGIAIFSKYQFENVYEDYYYKNKEDLYVCGIGGHQDTPMVLLSVNIEKDGEVFNILNTHFIKSNLEGGYPDEFQLLQVESLLSALNKHEEVIVCGDLNAPRGMPIFSKISEKYTDNIDQKYTRSLDSELHRRPDLELMVDGLFTSKHYLAKNMYFETGVSDHYAIVADIEKVKQISSPHLEFSSVLSA